MLFVVGTADVVVDERRVFAAEGLSLSPEDKLPGSADTEAACCFFDELHS